MANVTQEEEPSTLVRAMWTFLGYMLVGPLLAGLMTAAGLIVLPLVGMGAHLPQGLPTVGEAAAGAFVWAAIPAALAAIAVVPSVLRRGNFSWLTAAVAGGVAVFAAGVLTGQPPKDMMTIPAFLGALVSIGVREALISGRILKAGTASPA
ncbi:MAG: hypothetical protein NW217_13825 [Hyphomicrobiaceae bacterium]|nr:hypothetical protein [Hyphomicrobiaceae bacterium]